MSTTPKPALPWDPDAIARALTSDRLSPYRADAGGDLSAALDLYAWNMTACAAAMTTTGIVEVIVRNALDDQLHTWARQRHAGRSWLNAINLDPRGATDLATARYRATDRGRAPERHGKVVAELNFGFWRYLTTRRYLTSLWIPALHRAFPHGHRDLRQRREQVDVALQHMLFLRNRAAHHEPLLRRDLTADHQRATELIGWIDPHCAAWADAHSPLPSVSRQRPGSP